MFQLARDVRKNHAILGSFLHILDYPPSCHLLHLVILHLSLTTIGLRYTSLFAVVGQVQTTRHSHIPGHRMAHIHQTRAWLRGRNSEPRSRDMQVVPHDWLEQIFTLARGSLP